MDFNITAALRAAAALVGLGLLIAFSFGKLSSKPEAEKETISTDATELPLNTPKVVHRLVMDYAIDMPDADGVTPNMDQTEKTRSVPIHQYTVICSCLYDGLRTIETGPGLKYRDRYGITYRRIIETPLLPSEMNSLEAMSRVNFCPINNDNVGTPESLISVWYFGTI